MTGQTAAQRDDDALNIEAIETTPVAVPMTTDFTISGGGQERPTHVLVHLRTTSGIVGLGEASPKPFFSAETAGSVVHAIGQIEAALVGTDAGNLRTVHQAMAEAINGNPFAKTAVDIACHDALGKQLGVPVSRLLGGRVRDAIEVGQSVGIKPTEEAVAEAETYAHADGFGSIKVKVGDDPATAAERTRAISDAVDAETSLRVDANQGYTVDQAIPLFRDLEQELDLLLVEQPVSRDDIDGMRAVTDALETPVLADESSFSPQDAYTVASRNAADILNIKIMKAGGLVPSRQIAATATAAQLSLAVGSMVELGVGTAAGAHFAASVPNAVYPSDVKGTTLFTDTVLESPFNVSDGLTPVPTGPGLGVSLDEEKVEAFEVTL